MVRGKKRIPEVVPQKRKKGVIMGVGINDIKDVNRHEKAWVAWRGMLQRCYCKATTERHPTYTGCEVCEEWHYYSVFREWFYSQSHTGIGYDIDKDILCKDNKLYSPETCCLVPHRINCLLEKNQGQRGELPIGVYYDRQQNKYCSSIHINGTCQFLGRFDTQEDAFYAYKRVKEAYISLVAAIHYTNGYIDKRVYDALVNYEVQITD